MELAVKICIHCGNEKPLEEFKIILSRSCKIKIRGAACITCFRDRDAKDHRDRRRQKQLSKIIPLPGELWKDVPEYDRYEASNKGRVRNKLTGKLVTGSLNHDGYLSIKLSYNKYTYDTTFVHRVIAKTWIPNPNNLPEINHIVPDKTLNTVENLEWCDRLFNVQHSIRLGLPKYLSGTKSGSSKFTVEQINKIFELRARGLNYSEIGRHFNTNHQSVRSILVRQGWKHLIKGEDGRWYEPT